jgi:hypothetical protein
MEVGTLRKNGGRVVVVLVDGEGKGLRGRGSEVEVEVESVGLYLCVWGSLGQLCAWGLLVIGYLLG